MYFLGRIVLPHKPVDGVSEVFRNLVQLEALLVPFSQKYIQDKQLEGWSQADDHMSRSQGDHHRAETERYFDDFSLSFL